MKIDFENFFSKNILIQFTGLKDAKKQLAKGYKDLKPDKVEVSQMRLINCQTNQ